MILIRSIFHLLCSSAWTLIVALIGLPGLVTRASALWVIRFWVHGMVFLAHWLVGIRFEIRGKQYMDLEPSIIAAQHQSAFETFVLFLLFKRPVFILKQSLHWIPLVGWYIKRGGLITINRSAGASAMRRILKAADTAIANGETVLIFPEGTRTHPRARQDYKPGVIALYNHCQAPLVPMALNTGYFWGKNRLTKIPGTIVFEFLAPVAKGLDRNIFLSSLRHSIETTAAALPKSDDIPANKRIPTRED